MLWSLVLLLAFLAPGSQKASNMEMRQKSIIKPAETLVSIPCDLPDQSTKYVHWYQYQEGRALQRLLYYDFPNKKVVLDSGFSSEKYHDPIGDDMLWSLVLLLAFLAPDQSTNYVHWYQYQEGRALQRLLYYGFRDSKVVLDSGFSSEKYHVYEGSQKVSNIEMRLKSIIKPAEASVSITCDLPDQSTNYVHWYQYQEGRALQRLLYYNFPNKKVVLDSGFSSEKYHVYAGTGTSCPIGEEMLWSVALLLAFLAFGSQKASNMEMRQKSIIRPAEASVAITCDLPDQSTKYIHWYRYQEGRALQRLLYYYFRESKAQLDSGFSSEKYHAYEGHWRQT
ncbi:PREDICTED: uncharacterized protein LOC102821850 [Chrysochloris asiatica]|uniref:Uncharacterized protein LOC102821850 n=1 Tax=Chrysochloris asiatica TaxID=185453 RepID=A0A9B0T6X0_CHRAS|nr:PREDICTED: uncharacterized protein LOC102821850 [Chrysochloris asiatica]